LTGRNKFGGGDNRNEGKGGGGAFKKKNYGGEPEKRESSVNLV